jgi:putative membrane protein
MMMGFGLVGLTLMFLFWVLLIAGAVWVVKSIFPRGIDPGVSDGTKDQGAREILDRRYAKGEITREQHHLMSGDLQD